MIDYSSLKDKKIILTGHTGFKGSWMSVALDMLGAKVYGYALKPPTNPNMYGILGLDSIITSEIGDICDYEHLSSFVSKVQPDVIIHMAAQPLVLVGYGDPKYTYHTNVMGTVNILESIRHCESVKAFLNVTTDKVYLNLESDVRYRECDVLDGFDPYSNSKSCSELVTHCYRRSFFNNGPSIVTARAGNVIGGGDFANDRIIPDCIKYSLRKEPIIIRNPNSVRPYQHVLESIFAYLTIIVAQLNNSLKSHSFNVGPNDSDCITTGQLVTLFCKIWGSNANWKSINYDGPHEANYLHLDSSLINEELNFRTKLNINETVNWVVQWFNSWNKGYDMLSVTRSQIIDYIKKG